MYGIRLGALFVLVAVAVCGLGLAVPACGTGEIWFTYVDAGVDAGPDSGEGCEVGECVKKPIHWNGPEWVWIGPNEALLDPEETAPGCPFGMDDVTEEGYADLVVLDACEPCTCGPSTGACELPSSLTAHDVRCQDVGQPHKDIPFDAPNAWDGGCDNTTQVPANAAKSFTIAPLTVKEESCSVDHKTPARVLSPYWQTFARACYGHDWPQCDNPQGSCIDRTKAPFPGARLCVTIPGDDPEDCDHQWPERYVFYKDFVDERQCTECTCGPPVGSMCTSLLSVYENSDNTCGGPAAFPIQIGSATQECLDLAKPGQAMGSKSATQPTYSPGSCQPSPVMLDPDAGSITKTGPFTLCCKP